MKRSTSCLLFWGIFFSVFFTVDLPAQSPTKPQREYFFCRLLKGDFDSNPDLDFIIITYRMDDINKLPFQTIAVHRDCTENNSKILEKIRLEINEILSSNTFNKILVFGRYTASTRLLNGVFDGYLELTAIDIFNEDGIIQYFTIEGIRGGIRGKK